MNLNEVKILIKKQFKNFNRLPHKSVDKFLNKNIQLKQFLLNYFQQYKSYQNIYKMLFCFLKDIQLSFCKICKKIDVIYKYYKKI